MPDQAEADRLLSLTAQIVAAHVANNKLDGADVSALIGSVHRTLAMLGKAPAEPERPEPAVPIKKSVFPEYIVCLEDGKKLKMLKRHLKTAYNMTPEQYREKWGLGREYPMVAPNYAQHRSTLAKKIGLGRRQVVAKSPESASAKPGGRKVRKPAPAAAE
jgi:predicted transcriptional regulator